MGKLFKVTIIVISISNASATPLLQAAPCDGYKEAYELVRDGIEVVAVGKGFCIVRYGDGAGQPVRKAGTVELGSANRDIYIVESLLGQEWHDSEGIETLARFGDVYIVAVEPHLLATNWAGQFEIRKVFERPIQPPDTSQEYPPIEENGLIREIVDRLNAKDYGYSIENLVDVTPSRYALNPMIHTATHYLQREFDSYGLSTLLDYFPLEYGMIPNEYLNVHWYSDQTCWITSVVGYVWKTNDSGNVWDDASMYGSTYDIHLLTPEKGTIVGDYGLATTEDGGLSWSILETDNSEDLLYSLDYLDEYTGVACGRMVNDEATSYGNCFITRDGGLTWNQTGVPEADWLYSVCFRTPDEIWAGGDNSNIYRSIDGGQSFIEVETTGIMPGCNIVYIEIFNANDGVIAGDNGLLAYTEDGGETWTQTTSDEINFSEACFLDSNRGWVCGDYGTVKYTEDGGRSWNDRNIPEYLNIYSVSAKPNGEAWVCGEDSYVAYSEDTGLSWHEVDLSLPFQPKNNAENVIGELTGTLRPDEIYILCAHYDSTSEIPWYFAPGADDNASGSAAVLYLAEIMSQYEFSSTIRFCCWSAEELGLIGSEHYAADAQEWDYDIRGVYNMDMISYMNDDAFDSKIRYNYPSEPLLTACIDAGALYVPDLTIYPEPHNKASDHESFWNHDYPAIGIIEHAETAQDWHPWYHTTGDTYDRIRYDYGILNVKLGAALIGSLAQPLSGPTFAAGDVYAYPNPARPDTDFITFVNVPDGVAIEIYTITGDKVTTIYERNLDARWDMRNDSGDNVASGVYLYYLENGGDKKIGKVAVLH